MIALIVGGFVWAKWGFWWGLLAWWIVRVLLRRDDSPTVDPSDERY